ncbi:SymE family type I addiction module toxin [Pectobacterium sp. CHL-2024]|uniref:SymE family type I addiction module toxin n=1 Tax=Pectobacterium TaxID=122277 RepID=UPI001F07268D|nr:SymE family type I addiction module toxin [Pectobacterium brasiliense]
MRISNQNRALLHRDNGRSNLPSAINFKGRWLEESGFITGMHITVERGRIIIETQVNL